MYFLGKITSVGSISIAALISIIDLKFKLWKGIYFLKYLIVNLPITLFKLLLFTFVYFVILRRVWKSSLWKNMKPKIKELIPIDLVDIFKHIPVGSIFFFRFLVGFFNYEYDIN